MYLLFGPWKQTVSPKAPQKTALDSHNGVTKRPNVSSHLASRGKAEYRTTHGKKIAAQNFVSIFSFFFVTLTPSELDVRKAAFISGGLFGTPSIGHQTASPERKETGKKRGIEDQVKNFDQKGTAGDRIEQSR